MWCGTTRIILQRLHVNDVPQPFKNKVVYHQYDRFYEGKRAKIQ